MLPSFSVTFFRKLPLLRSVQRSWNDLANARKFLHHSTHVIPTSTLSLRRWRLDGVPSQGYRLRSSTSHAHGESRNVFRKRLKNCEDGKARVDGSGISGSTATLPNSSTYGALPILGEKRLRGNAEISRKGEDTLYETYDRCRLESQNRNTQASVNRDLGWNINQSVVNSDDCRDPIKLRQRETTLAGVCHSAEVEEGYDPESDDAESKSEITLTIKDFISPEEAILQVETDDPFSIRAPKSTHDIEEGVNEGIDVDEELMADQEVSLDETLNSNVSTFGGWKSDGSSSGLNDNDRDEDNEARASKRNSLGRILELNDLAESTEVRADEVLQSKYLQEAFPDLAAEYSAAGSENAIPVEDLTINSAMVAVWRCLKCNGTWKCAVFVRCVLKIQCPSCNAREHPTLAMAHPDLVPFWDSTRNNPFLSVETVDCNSAISVCWLCPTCGQGYVARVRDRVRGKAACPSCALTHVQSADIMAREEGALLQEWHPLKNGDLRLDQLQTKDHRTKVWWLCSLCGHDWEASLATRLSRSRRAKGRLCPACQSKGVGLA